MLIVAFGKQLLPQISYGLAPRLASHFSKFNCGGCAKKLTVPECNACDRMLNYFQIFSMYSPISNRPENYKVDPDIIKAMARDLQKEFHPDKSGEQEDLKLRMENYSSYINEAKAILLNDLQRALYLM